MKRRGDGVRSFGAWMMVGSTTVIAPIARAQQPPGAPARLTVTFVPENESDRSPCAFATIDEVGRDCFLFGNQRVCRGETDLVASVDGFTTPIVYAVRASRGWVFVSGDGETARADGFLGTLTSLGSFRHFEARPSGAGRASLIDESGYAWTTDGAAPWRRLDLPRPIHEVIFVSAERGVAVVGEGDALQTHDGGTDRLDCAQSRSQPRRDDDVA